MFNSLANQLEVFYSDKLLLEEWGVRTADEFFFRLPSAETLENLLSDKIFPNTAATDEDGGIVVSTKEGGTPAALREWLRGPAAAAIRRLWEASKAAAKRDLAKLTEDKAEGDLPSRLTAPHVSDLATRAAERGLPPVSDVERPGPVCLGKVADNHRFGGAFAHLEWEEYTSEEEEARAKRLGGKPKGQSLQFVDGALKTVATGDDPQRPRVNELLALQDTLMVRTVAHEYLQPVSHQTYQRLTNEFLRLAKKRQPDLMRGPTINEIRLVDRLIHEEILAYVAKNEETLEGGVAYYVSEMGRKSPFWSFLEGQREDQPDRGLERPLKQMKLSNDAASGSAPAGPQKPVAKCFACGKSRADHPQRKFCRQPAKAESGQVASAHVEQEISKVKGKGKKGKGKGKVPPHMVGMAARTSPSQAHPAGQAFCHAFHDPNGSGCSGNCGFSHACCKFVNGAVCGGAHQASRCQA